MKHLSWAPSLQTGEQLLGLLHLWLVVVARRGVAEFLHLVVVQVIHELLYILGRSLRLACFLWHVEQQVDLHL